jgi:serine protease AprX
VLPLAWTGLGSAPALLTKASASATAPSLASVAIKNPSKQVEVVAQLNSRVRWDQGPKVFAAYGGTVTRNLHIIRGYGVRMSAFDAQRLANDARLRGVTLNYVVGSSTVGPDPTLVKTGFLQSVRMDKVWQSAAVGTGKGVGVAVVDTGIAGDLVDFRKADGTSRVVASIATNPDATTVNDLYGHGTHVAGLLAGDSRSRPAGDPLRGAYEGVAPDANLVNVKVSDDHGGSSVLDVIYGLQFVADHKADYNIRVVNLSLNESTPVSYKADPLDAAVESLWFKGIVVVASAGNRGTAPDAVSYAPANDPFVISVGAVDDGGTKQTGDDYFMPWSSRGVTQDGISKPEVAAPGSHMVGPLAPNSDFASLCPSCIVDGSYFRVGGTSMSAPIVSGIAAAMVETHPDWTPDMVKVAMVKTLRKTSDGQGNENAADQAIGTNQTPVTQTFAPNPLVDPTTGNIDYTRASWSRASWSCDCLGTQVIDPTDPTRASWSRASWSRASWSDSFGL